MRIVPCRPSLPIYEGYKLNYQQADRGFSAFAYLGLYSNKAVRFVGRVELEVLRFLDDNGDHVLTPTSSFLSLSAVQRDRRFSRKGEHLMDSAAFVCIPDTMMLEGLEKLSTFEQA